MEWDLRSVWGDFGTESLGFELINWFLLWYLQGNCSLVSFQNNFCCVFCWFACLFWWVVPSRDWGQGLACAKCMLYYSVTSLAVLVILILSLYPSEIETRVDSQPLGKVSSFKTVDAGFEHLFLLLKWSSDFCLWVYLCDILQLLIEPSLNHLWKEANFIMMKSFFDGFLNLVCKYFIEMFCNCIHQGYTEQKLNNCQISGYKWDICDTLTKV